METATFKAFCRGETVTIVLRCINCHSRFTTLVTMWTAQAMLFRRYFDQETGCFRMLCSQCGKRKLK